MANYPASLATWSDVVDGVDWPQAFHVNQPNNEVIAVETELGTDVAGSATDLKTRLAKSLDNAGHLDFATSTELTISGGSITPTQNWHTVDTEGDAASDDLDTIVASGVSDGFVLFFRANHASRTVVIKNGTGNITCATEKDISLVGTSRVVRLTYDSTLTKWIASVMYAVSGNSTTLGTVLGALTQSKQLAFDANGNIVASASDIGGGKGRVIFHTSHSPNTLGAGVNSLAGGSTPTEQYLHYVFANTADSYREWLCSLQGYNGGGLTFKFLVLRSSAGAGETYIFDMAIRRIQAGTTELSASKSYDYNSVTVTIPAGPPAATIPMLATITFTDGADMDSLADGEFFVLRLRRDVDDTATDSCLVLAGMIGIET